MLRTPRAAIFDLDGVIVDTARLHGRAWKEAFDSFFAHRGLDDTFDEVDDYRGHVDGRPRYEGVAALLESRHIELPAGDPSDEPGFDTHAAIGNLKNQRFHELVESEGVDVLDGADELIHSLDAQNVPMAVVSSSKNAPRVLPQRLASLIDVVFSGIDVAELEMPGKPAPDMFLEGARRLGVDPGSAAVVEDAPAGVRAGRLGGFAVVVGIDAEGSSHLEASGADFVVGAVGSLPHDVEAWADLVPDPPDAMESFAEIVDELGERPAIFLDYDGTLTPIVEDPDAADIGDEERAVLVEVATRVPLAIVSGRGLADVKSHVAVEGITYSGSHGFEIEMADGRTIEQDAAAEAVPELDEAERMLRAGAADLAGIMIERKPYAIAVHTRRASTEGARVAAGELAHEVVSRFDGLVLRGGKEIHELRPAIDWDKGAALSHLRSLLSGDPLPLYIGDDETDEDGFRAVRCEGGLGVLVGRRRGAETWADYTLEDPARTIEFLSRLASSLRA
ncbi:MAG: trehalose-phosphatase [Acidimicrobiia bacterium]|jgi:alpha,alpha-trehalase